MTVKSQKVESLKVKGFMKHSQRAALAAVIVIVMMGGASAHAGEFFGSGLGLRAMAMGGAFVAVADDTTGGFWNPAGLAGLPGLRLLGALSLQGPASLENLQSYAASATLGATTLAGTFAHKTFLRGIVQDERTLLIGSVAMHLGLIAGGGVNIKFYEHILAGQKARGVGLDAGLLIRPTGPLAVGVVFRDAIGTKLRPEDETLPPQEIPPSIKLGMAARLWGVLVAADFDFAGKVVGQPRFGLEARPFGLLALRVGKSGDNWTAGFGLGIENLISIDAMLFSGGWLLSTELILFGF